MKWYDYDKIKPKKGDVLLAHNGKKVTVIQYHITPTGVVIDCIYSTYGNNITFEIKQWGYLPELPKEYQLINLLTEGGIA